MDTATTQGGHPMTTRTIARMSREGHTITVDVDTTSDRAYVRRDGSTIRTIGRDVDDPIRTALRFAGHVYATSAIHGGRGADACGHEVGVR